MVHLVCLFVKTHLLVLLQDNCLDLVCRAFLEKLSACVRITTVFCQHLPRLIVLDNTDIEVKPKYWTVRSARLIYQSISSLNSSLAQLTGELWSCKDIMEKLYLLVQLNWLQRC